MLVGVAKGRALPATECVISNGHRDRHVDTDHADIHPRREFARGMAVASEDRDAVTILMLAGQGECVLEAFGAHHLQHGAENLFLIGPHAGLDLIEQRRADEKALLMPL